MGKRKLAKHASDSDDSDYAPDMSESYEKLRSGPQRNGLKKYKSRHSSQEKTEMGGEGLECLPPHSVSAHVISDASNMNTALLGWFSGVHDSRGMPWRKRYDPTLGSAERSQRAYEVWVSEIMLQQTQVVTVIPYYNRWMERFPTIRDLAAASVDEVNALWKGLGYYSRASRLLAGAQKVVKEHKGRLPDNAKDLEASIPGIGRYSAGAIASIAYGERVPVLDGNVHRLLSRLLALHASPKSKSTLDLLWSAATDVVRVKGGANVKDVVIDLEESSPMVETRYAGDINQALIELGSTVCKVRDPDCSACPLRPWCHAYGATSGASSKSDDLPDIEELCTLCEPLRIGADVTSYPMKVDRKKQREELDIVNVVEWRSSEQPEERYFLMTRRPAGGLLAGLYEFPTSTNVSKTLSASAQSKLPKEVLSRILQSPINSSGAISQASADTVSILSVKPAQDVLHIFSHIKKTYRPQWVLIQGGESVPNVVAEASDARWVPLREVMNANMGTGTGKVWHAVSASWSN